MTKGGSLNSESKRLTDDCEANEQFDLNAFNDTILIGSRPGMKTLKASTIDRKLASRGPKFEPVRAIMQERETGSILHQNQTT